MKKIFLLTLFGFASCTSLTWEKNDKGERVVTVHCAPINAPGACYRRAREVCPNGYNQYAERSLSIDIVCKE